MSTYSAAPNAIDLGGHEHARKDYTLCSNTSHRCIELLSSSALAPLFMITIRPISLYHGPTQLLTAFVGDKRMGDLP